MSVRRSAGMRSRARCRARPDRAHIAVGNAIGTIYKRPPLKPRLPQLRTIPMTFTLPDLPYSHDALAPHMSRETLEYHHDKHHLAYVNAGHNLIKGTEWEGKSLEEVVKGSFGKNAGLFNNAGQHYNHTHFWRGMKPGGFGDKIPGNLEKKIVSDLGSVAKM